MSKKTSKKEMGNSSMRQVEIERKTKETQVAVKINLDGNGIYDINTSIAFFDHMLILFTRHSGVDLEIKAEGDLDHHLVEDVGIVLGQAINEALGDKKGIRRYGDKKIPMDESLAICALDLGGRVYHKLDLKLKPGNIEDLDAENIVHFFESLTINAKINLHIIVEYGDNEHHKAEAVFKSFAHAFKEAIEIIGDKIPSTKGTL